MRKLSLSHAEDIRELIEDALRGSDEQRFLHRLHCVLLVSRGRSCGEAAELFDEDPRTIQRWVHAFERRGADGLRDHHAGGRHPRLSRAQARRLEDDLRAPPTAAGYRATSWDGRLLAGHVKNVYGITLGVRQCQRIIARMR